MDAEVPLIGIAAVLRPEKRIDLLLAAHARVRSVVPRGAARDRGRRGMPAGPGTSGARPRARRRASTSSERRTDVDSVLRAADVGALSSDREGSPLLVFECMANGTPLVATAVGGVPDVVAARAHRSARSRDVTPKRSRTA